MDRIKNYFIRPWDSDAMDSITPISSTVRQHLILVYCALFYSFAFLLSGAVSHLLFDNGGLVSAVGFIGSAWWISRVNPWKEVYRQIFLVIASYCFGATLGPLINLIIEIDQRNIIKILFGSILFLSCYLGSTVHSLERTVMYKLAEYSAPIVISAWMVHCDTYPGFLSHVICLLCLPFQWYAVVQVGAYMGRRLRVWYNFPVHLVWILFLCYCYGHSILDLVYMYVILAWYFVHMNMYNQLVISRAIHNSDESYYISDAITFFTEFPVPLIHILTHARDVNIMARKIRTRPEAANPRPRRRRIRGGRR